MALSVSDVLDRFLPRFISEKPSLNPDQWRAIRAIERCRTPALGAEGYTCGKCGKVHWACHSCNHKACPRCGRDATSRWVQRELGKLLEAPYFMGVFTLPAQLRGLFHGPEAKAAFDLFFHASSKALSEKLAASKWLGAATNGFSGVLHTWNQKLERHFHIHYILPGAGLDTEGRFVRVKSDSFLLPEAPLQGAFRAYFREGLAALGWGVDPQVWRMDWGVKIQAFGTGHNALKYLGSYVSRSAIGDHRILAMTEETVTFSWKDRRRGGHNESLSLPGTQFVKRYLDHVQPRGLRSIRYFGFCHPAAKKKRLRIQFHSGRPLVIQAGLSVAKQTDNTYACQICGGAMYRTHSLAPSGRITRYNKRGPPQLNIPREAAVV